MKKTFTQNTLIRKIYGETCEMAGKKMDEALAADWQLKESYEALKEVAGKLDALRFRPSRTSVQIILAHSRKTTPVATSC